MNLDELRSVQSKERAKDSLQHLRESFYADVGEYVAALKDQRDHAAEQADDPFDDPEVNRLTDEVHTAEEVVEAVYERRVGKVVKRASLAAAGMPVDEDGLTSEEQELFAELVERIESNKADVLDVLSGENAHARVPSSASDRATVAPDEAPSRGASAVPDSSSAEASADAADQSEGVSAADLMGGDDADASNVAESGSASAKADSTPSDDARPADEAATIADDGDDSASAPADDDPTAGLDERTTIRITRDVGEIFGVDERTYDLASEDVVTLPEENAAPLVERGAAKELD